MTCIACSIKENNKLKHLGKRDWQRIQLLVSMDLDPDGDPGNLTARAIRGLQQEIGHDSSGVLTPCLERHLDAKEKSLWENVEASGVWADTDSRWTVKNAHRLGELFNRIGMDHIQLQLNHSGDTAFKSMWSEDRIKQFSGIMAGYGVTVGLMPWVIPNREWINGLEAALPGLLAAIQGDGPYEIDSDVEAPWSPDHLEGYEKTYAAADHLASVIKKATEIYPNCRIGSTAFADGIRGKNGSRQYAVKALGKYQAVQLYSTVKAAKGDWFDQDGPARRQHRDIESFLKLGFKRENLIAGNAAYNQSFDGVDPVTARYFATLAALCRGVRVFRDWSLKALAQGSSADDRAKQRYNQEHHSACKKRRGL